MKTSLLLESATVVPKVLFFFLSPVGNIVVLGEALECSTTNLTSWLDPILLNSTTPAWTDSDDKIHLAFHQILILAIVLGRWILPKGKINQDELSQLLLIFIGTGADIVEFVR